MALWLSDERKPIHRQIWRIGAVCTLRASFRGRGGGRQKLGKGHASDEQGGEQIRTGVLHRVDAVPTASVSSLRPGSVTCFSAKFFTLRRIIARGTVALGAICIG
jgi:hypothetical protein